MKRIFGPGSTAWAGLFALGFAGASTHGAAEEKRAAPVPAAAGSARKAAATARGKKGPPPVTVNVAALSERLKSADTAEVVAALDQARAAGPGATPVAPAIEDLLRRGTLGEVTGAALGTLGAIGAPSSAGAIVPYAHHRNPDTRRKALGALGRTGGEGAVAALRGGLSDPDASVRGVAASSLGAAHGREAIDDLFAALDHGVAEAAAAIGQLCTAAECEKLAGKLTTFGLDVMTSAFDPLLFRPASEVSDDVKVRIVEKVRDLHTAEANKYLRDLQSRWPSGESPQVRQAIDQAVLATAGAKS